jgi:hypothetical protein
MGLSRDGAFRSGSGPVRHCRLLSAGSLAPRPQLAHLLPDLHSQALGMWTYWDAFLGPSSRDESQAGLIVLFAPLYQLARLGLTVLLACLLDRPRYPQNL